MTATQLINYNIPVLQEGDTVDKALQLFEELKIMHLPYLSEGQLTGMYEEDTLFNYNLGLQLSEIEPVWIKNPIRENDSLLVSIQKAQQSDSLDVLPVVGRENQYIGVIEKLNLYSEFINSLQINETGSSLEITLKRNNYSLADISRIIENESAKIISLYITTENTEDITVSLKLDKTQISNVISALERYGYEISAYHSTENVNNLEKDRYDLLMKYLSI